MIGGVVNKTGSFEEAKRERVLVRLECNCGSGNCGACRGVWISIPHALADLFAYYCDLAGA